MEGVKERAKAVLVTGGLGYVGSHAVAALAQAGLRSVIVDNLSNSRPDTLDALARICDGRPEFAPVDIRDREALRGVLARHPVTACVHFAGLKAVADSVRDPVGYYDVNVGGSAVLFQELARAGCRRIVFSSSATVYGDPDVVPIPESHAVAPVNPYGRSKAMVEQLLRDLCDADARVSAVCLRYFNPAGAHPGGLIGERPNGTPNNLMPYVSQVANGQRPQVQVFGDDYPTPDGTGVRDYVHVMDLADAHVRAVAFACMKPGFTAINLGTGQGASVLEVIAAYARAAGAEVPHSVAPRRAGDIAVSCADPSRALALLGWRARRTLQDMCRDAVRFERKACGAPDGMHAMRAEHVSPTTAA